MKSLLTERKFSGRDLAFESIVFILVVSIIVYFLPRENKFNYSFDINKPWKYGLLQASFDFPIYKSDEAIKKEKDSLMANYAPYYTIDKNTAVAAINKFNQAYQSSLRQFLPPIYRQYIINGLTHIYEAGIINADESSRLNKLGSNYIQIVADNLSREVAVNQLYTSKEAYNYLMSADTSHLDRQILQRCNLNEYITTNLHYDSQKSEDELNDLLSSISYATGYVLKGQRIIDRGEIVNQQTYDILKSLAKEWDKNGNRNNGKKLTLFGQILFVAIMISLIFVYLEMFRHDYISRKRCIYLIFTMILSFSIITSLMIREAFLSIYILPFSMIPIVIRIFLDGRTSFVINTISILLYSISLRLPYDFVLIQMVGGMVATYNLRELSQRSQIIRSAVLVTLSTSLMFFALDLIHVSNVNELSIYLYAQLAIAGVLLLFTYPLLLVLERTFRFTSNVTLIELSNINNKLMREMSEIAPGTFQHSLQLANLTAAAANRIGANSQLVRTGAMYHDIGKMLNPAFFTENQSGVNPHEQLTPKQSAQVVISHVTDGMKLAEKHNLPEVVRDFICTHHGLGLTKYFYVTYCNEHPDEEVNKADFQYPGPNPFTREQAILMMADGVEAASRSLKEYTEESISAVVDKLVDAQVAEGYFRNCPITFKEIETVKTVFKEKLKTMYHTRISYPELKK